MGQIWTDDNFMFPILSDLGESFGGRRKAQLEALAATVAQRDFTLQREQEQKRTQDALRDAVDKLLVGPTATATPAPGTSVTPGYATVAQDPNVPPQTVPPQAAAPAPSVVPLPAPRPTASAAPASGAMPGMPDSSVMLDIVRKKLAADIAKGETNVMPSIAQGQVYRDPSLLTQPGARVGLEYTRTGVEPKLDDQFRHSVLAHLEDKLAKGLKLSDVELRTAAQFDQDLFKPTQVNGTWAPTPSPYSRVRAALGGQTAAPSPMAAAPTAPAVAQPPPAAGTVGGPVNQQDTDINALDRIRKSPEYKQYASDQQAWNGIVASLNEKSRTGDMAAVKGILSILGHGSGAEGQQIQTAGLPEQINKALETLQSGKDTLLSDKQRADIAKVGKQLIDKNYKGLTDMLEAYAPLLKQGGARVDQIFPRDPNTKAYGGILAPHPDYVPAVKQQRKKDDPVTSFFGGL